MTPYQPPTDPQDSVWYLIAVTLGTAFAVVMVLILFGCSSPTEPVNNRDGLVIQRPCSDCHIVVNGEIKQPKERLLK